MADKNYRYMKRVLSVLLVISLLMSTLSGCAKPTASPSEESHTAGPEATVDLVSDPVQAEPIAISYAWEDYVGDIDTIVYGLISNQYALCYTVFRAVVELPDGTEVYGIGYTDFADFYETDRGTGFFPAGFIRLVGEPEIPAEYIEQGLEIQDLENITDVSFVYAYEIEPYMEHCVVWGQYLQYGIDESDGITYSVQEYERGSCDENLGALYSYDEGRFVYDPNIGKYLSVTGTTLSELVDYHAIEAEINRILTEQDFNFSTVDIWTSAYFAQEAVNSYLLSMQEETFFEIKVSELVQEVQDLDPTEYIRITPDGIVIADMEESIPEDPSTLAKWLVGMSCGIVVASSIALEILVPVLRPINSAISGAAVEVFMQVVIQNQALSNVQWSRVAVAAVSGALLAWACPLAAGNAAKGVVNAAGKEVITLFGKEIETEALAKLAGYSVLTFSNAMVSGATSAVFTYIDGGSDDESLDSFMWGAVIGGACTVFASVLSEVSNAGMNALAKSHPNNWFVKNLEKVGAFIGKHQIHLKDHQELENILAPKSVYEAAKCAINELQRKMSPTEILQAKLQQLSSDKSKDFIKVDAKGNQLTKAQVAETGGNCIIKPAADCDPEILKVFKQNNITEIVVKDGVPDFSVISEYSFVPNDAIGPNRDINMKKYYDQLADEWIEHSERIPAKIRTVLTDAQLENLDSTMVQEALSKARLTPHESIDGVVYLVDHYIHAKISHYGGVALAKAEARLALGVTYVKQLAYGTATSITGTLIAEEVSQK